MTIKELTRNCFRLARIMCHFRNEINESDGISEIALCFEGGEVLTMKADGENDELVWDHVSGSSVAVSDLALIYPSIGEAYGLSLIWSWEMTNHQGYFDAVQLELTDSTLARTAIFQFKVTASSIEVFEIKNSKNIKN
jgi:hypothetical protein